MQTTPPNLFDKFNLIDCFLVEQNLKQTENVYKGLIVVENNKSKVPNFGTIKAVPKIITKKSDEEYNEVFKHVNLGDRVFFPLNISYNVIENSSVPDECKWLIVPVQYIQGIEK